MSKQRTIEELGELFYGSGSSEKPAGTEETGKTAEGGNKAGDQV